MHTSCGQFNGQFIKMGCMRLEEHGCFLPQTANIRATLVYGL